MLPCKRLVIIAGEESGDQHAAQLVRLLKAKHPSLLISGIGGKHMEAAGVPLISDLARFGVTGLMEVFRHLRVIHKAERAIRAHLTANKPDLLILVDYPGFNLRLAKFAKRTLGCRILYYISPQIWAWKAKRIHVIRECVDHMAVILPFEKKIYEHAGVPVSFVGHPLTARIDAVEQNLPRRETYGLPSQKRLIALLPGSRINEIERHMPVLRDTAIQLAKQFPDLHFVLPIAGSLEPAMVKSFWPTEAPPCTFIQGKALEIAACSDFIIVGSGTASLECALLKKPMCIIYKVSFISSLAVAAVIKVKYLGLCNLLQQKMIVPELLQYDCNVTELTRVMHTLLTDPTAAANMQGRLATLKHSLSLSQMDTSLLALVESMLF
jgi:lipid-A-disaccharide synthase